MLHFLRDFIKLLDYWVLSYMQWAYPHPIEEVPITPPEAPNLPQDEFLPITKPIMSKADILYNKAVSSIGRDMSPLDKAPDSLGCMESVDGVWLAAFGEHLLDPAARLSTEEGYKAMVKDPRLEQIQVPTKGAIVISPTGFSSKGSKHGHCGIVGNYDIMSNDSNSGIWQDNYTKDGWKKVFGDTLGFPIYYFLPVDTTD